MPPTVLLIFSLYFCILLFGLALLVCAPMLFFKTRRITGISVILTAMISYPLLIIVGLTLTIIFALPGIGLIYLLNYLNLIPLTGIFVLIFFILIAFLWVYHMYLGYIMIRNYLNNWPIAQQIETDKVYSILLKRVVNFKKNKI